MRDTCTHQYPNPPTAPTLFIQRITLTGRLEKYQLSIMLWKRISFTSPNRPLQAQCGRGRLPEHARRYMCRPQTAEGKLKSALVFPALPSATPPLA